MDIKEYIESGIIESYVLGLTDTEEAIEVEQLSKQYSEVQDAIDSFSSALEANAFENAVTPPPEIKEQLMAEISANAPESTSVESPLVVAYNSTLEEKPELSLKSGSVGMWKYVAAASIILLLVSGVGNFVLYNKYSNTSNQYLALLSEKNTLQASNKVYQVKLDEYKTAAGMMADPTVTMVAMHDPANRKDVMTTVFWDQKTKDVYLMTNKLPSPEKDKQYQLWALVDGKPVDAGMLDPECTSLCKMKNIPKAQAFAITLENAGGSPVPTMEQLYVLGKI